MIGTYMNQSEDAIFAAAEGGFDIHVVVTISQKALPLVRYNSMLDGFHINISL